MAEIQNLGRVDLTNIAIHCADNLHGLPILLDGNMGIQTAVDVERINTQRSFRRFSNWVLMQTGESPVMRMVYNLGFSRVFPEGRLDKELRLQIDTETNPKLRLLQASFGILIVNLREKLAKANRMVRDLKAIPGSTEREYYLLANEWLDPNTARVKQTPRVSYILSPDNQQLKSWNTEGLTVDLPRDVIQVWDVNRLSDYEPGLIRRALIPYLLRIYKNHETHIKHSQR